MISGNRTLFIQLALLCLLSYQTVAQPAATLRQTESDSLKLDYIKDFRIKIDGGGSYFTCDSTALAQKKYILVISAENVAFINVKDSYVYLKRTKRTVSGDSLYTDIYSGGGYKIILVAARESPVVDHSSTYKGTMQVKYKGSTLNVKVHGRVDSY